MRRKATTLVEAFIGVVFILIIGAIVAGAVGLKGCSAGIETGASTKHEMEQTEANHARLVQAVPPPTLNTSLERKNGVRRLQRFNDENKVSYIYLINYGKIMAFYTVKGKVSSVNSLLTTPDQIVTVRRGMEGLSTHVVASPALDGSYGTNGDAIYFFTTADVYVEWKGDYMLCDQSLKLTSPAALVIHVEDEDAGPGE